MKQAFAKILLYNWLPPVYFGLRVSKTASKTPKNPVINAAAIVVPKWFLMRTSAGYQTLFLTFGC